MLASYSAEEAMPTNNPGAVDLAGILAGQMPLLQNLQLKTWLTSDCVAENGQQPTPAMQSAQIENLEGQVKELSGQVELLEDSISQSANLAKRLQEELADTLAKAQNAESERDRLQGEADHLNAEVAQLQVMTFDILGRHVPWIETCCQTLPFCFDCCERVEGAM